MGLGRVTYFNMPSTHVRVPRRAGSDSLGSLSNDDDDGGGDDGARTLLKK